MSYTNLFYLALILFAVFGTMLLVRKLFYNEEPRCTMHSFDTTAICFLIGGVICGYGSFAWWMMI